VVEQEWVSGAQAPYPKNIKTRRRKKEEKEK